LLPYLTTPEREELDRLARISWLGLRPNCPEPHDKQREFVESSAPRKVVVTGRRGGKTTGLALLAAHGFNRGRRVLYAGPTSEQTDRFWYAARAYFDADIRAGRLVKTETKRIIEQPGSDENAPRIRAKTAWDADTLRGDWGDLLLLDEYSLMKPDVDEVILPMLLDRGGAVVYGGTPRFRNQFFHKYQEAVQDTTGRWGHWHFTSHDNPFLSRAALDEIVQDLSEEGYRQEILAEFLEGEGVVFRNIRACLGAPMDAMPQQHLGHRIVAGVDWGKQADFTAVSVGCADCCVELALDRFNQIDYVFQRGRLEALCDKWHVAHILAESNAMGEPVIEELQRSGLPVAGFATTAASKPPLIESLALALERTEWQWLDVPVATGELEAYERKVLATTGRSSYGAPAGLHDDTVIARALMHRAATGGGPSWDDVIGLGEIDDFESKWA